MSEQHGDSARGQASIPFIKPMAPALAKTPPAGADWIHEVKFDGWRAQIHVEGGSATIYSKNGADYTKRFRALRNTIEGIPAKSAIIDCELVACDETGMPCFRTLMELGNKAPGLCLWCFDLLSIDGARITPLPLHQRKAMLAKLVAAVGDEHLQFSGAIQRPDQAARDLSENEPRGHRFEAARVGLPFRPDARLAEDQDCELACCEPRSPRDVREEALKERPGYLGRGAPAVPLHLTNGMSAKVRMLPMMERCRFVLMASDPSITGAQRTII